VNWLAFGSAELGWREGLPFEFHVEVRDDRLVISPVDRTWIGRTLTESWDARDRFSPAIDTFWYGYNDRIWDRELMKRGTPTNYTERRLLWILRWARDYFGTDPVRTVLVGGSMGGCGGLSFGLRHPEIFTAVIARVPLVGYFNEEECGVGEPGAAVDMASEKRLTAFCGPLGRKDNEGTILRERMDSRTVLREALESGTDLPFLIISNSRRDRSIPWKPNPRYFRALNRSGQGFMAAWDDGEHSNSMRGADPWFKKWRDPASFFGFSLEESFPAFNNCSENDDPGNGDTRDGDITGYMNFGLEWREVTDSVDEYSVTVFIAAGSPDFPVSVDIIPRRVRNFVPEPGERVNFVNWNESGEEVSSGEVMVDGVGRVTVEEFLITGPYGNRLTITRKPE
jgi:pimeloyl-ACP methyl ester carboxylesterase